MPKKIKKQSNRASETSKIRRYVLPYILKGWNGIDLGYGGDPIVLTAICMDSLNKYTSVGANTPQHLYGDARDLYWFADDALDYVYSSHLLEDFEETEELVREWLRVIRPEGLLMLYLPDEQTYRAYCLMKGHPQNMLHKHDYMSLSFMRRMFKELDLTEEVFAMDVDSKAGLDYSFLIIVRKK